MKTTFKLVLLMTAFAVGACSSEQPPEPEAVVTLDDIPMIPRKSFFDDPDKTQGRISPDGTRVSYIAPVDGTKNVWVAPVDDPDAGVPVTHDTSRGTTNHFWAADNKHIIYLRDVGGDENFHLIAVNVDTGESRDLTDYENTLGQLVGGSYTYRDKLLIGMNDRDPRFHDVYLVDINTAERELVELNDGFAGYVPDHDLNIRVGVKPTADGGMSLQRKDEDGAWVEFMPVSADEVFAMNPLGFSRDGERFYLVDATGRDTSALYQVDIETGERLMIAGSDQADMGATIFDQASEDPIAYSINYMKSEWHPIGASGEAALAPVSATIPGEATVVSQTEDDSRWVVVGDSPTAPDVYYLVDHEAGKTTKLFETRSALEGQPLSETYPVVIKSRDGLDLVSYLTLPPHLELSDDMTLEEPVPMVLWVHGGPWGRDSYGYSSIPQWFGNRGYATLQVNFRASTGFGKAFVNAGAKEWAMAMHDDLIDGVDWAIERNITSDGQVAIGGGSYGGYATLAGVTFTPEKFACGVDIVGPSNLETLINSVPEYWTSFFEVLVNNVGDPRTEEGRRLLRSRSPLYKADQITKPLLIGQGANDPRVKQAESDQIVDAMKAAGLPVTYVLYPDEGHGFGRAPNLDSFLAISEVFLAECLGGRSEDFGTAFEESSATVPHGIEFVPGLKDALEAASTAEKY